MKRDKVRILVVDDEEIVRESLLAWLSRDGYHVETAPDGASALARLGEAEPWTLLLVDLKMPGGVDGLQVLEGARKREPAASIVVMTAYASVDTAVTAMKLGAYDYIAKPFEPEELSLLVGRIVEEQALRHENALLRKVVRKEYRFRDLESRSPAMQALFELAHPAARSGSTILILGESGTGKELLARAIHAESPRAKGPFVAVSCAALTETLLESELFGYEKGAFTGASTRRRGKFEAAQGGTLFLDEIGDVSPKLQMDLLRVLEERRFTRVGATESIEADVRIIAATHRDLAKLVEQGQFRQDLYYRLNVIPMQLPPLRERMEDLPLLVETLIEHLSTELGRGIDGVSAEAMQMLLAHDWPGNVRELRNVLERGIVVAHGRILQDSDLALPPRDLGAGAADGTLPSLEEVERRHVAHVLDHVHGNVSQAARILGIDRSTLYAKIHRFGLRAEG
jgi:two-component system, NtrC family, response regulator AtoC